VAVGGSFDLNKNDIKSAYIAVAIAAVGGLYYMYQKGKTGGSGNALSNLLGNNNQSAANGSAGAIAPSSSINTYNVFPTVSSQQSTSNAFYNAPHGNSTPTTTQNGSQTWLSNGQAFSLPVAS
jgi:hypothetical protein